MKTIQFTKQNKDETMCKITILALLISGLLLNVTDILAQGDLLNETKFHAIPEEMTFEEYQDANRRVVSGVIVSSLLPVPGMMHFYAGEPKTGYRLLGLTGIGVLSISCGFASMSEGDNWVDSDYQTVDIGDQRYEKIPIIVYDDNGVENTGYTLNKLDKEIDGAALGVSLIALGAGTIIFSHIYDWIHGIQTIENKRGRVRYNYGKELNFSIKPEVDPNKSYAGVSLAVKF